MKRLISAAILAAVSLAFAASTAQAQAVKWIDRDMYFTHARANVAGYIAQLDSVASYTMGNYAAISLIDTTDILDVRSLHFRGPHIGWHTTIGSITDTIPAFTISLWNANGAAVTGADSLEVTIQKSADRGITWTSVDTIGVSNKLRFDLTSASGASATLSSTAGGIGTQRINWDRASNNWLRFLLRRDPNATSGVPIKLTVSYRPNGTNF